MDLYQTRSLLGRLRREPHRGPHHRRGFRPESHIRKERVDGANTAEEAPCPLYRDRSRRRSGWFPLSADSLIGRTAVSGPRGHVCGPETFRRGLYLRRDSGRGRVTLGKSDPQDYQPVCVVFPKPSEKELEWMERFPTRPDVVVLPNTSL